MAQEKLPILITYSGLIKPLLYAKSQVERVETQAITNNFDNIILKGLLVLLIANLETMISGTLRYYLRMFPQKLEAQEFKFSKDQLLSSMTVTDLIETRIAKKLRELGYANFDEILSYFFATLAIDDSSFNEDILEAIRKFKAKRNSILHSDTGPDSFYINDSGKLAQTWEDNDEVKLEYLLAAIKRTKEFLMEIESRLKAKYSKFTKIKALEELWYYLFDSPIMKFEDYWVLDRKNDHVKATKEQEIETQLSSSEKMFLGVWRAHFSGYAENMKVFHMKSLDSRNRFKMHFLLSILPEIALA